jgi:hypothetical protein
MQTQLKHSNETQTARLATLDELRKNLFPVHLNPVPCRTTCKNWLDDAKIPRLKTNPFARRGGGPCYYQVSAVEKFLRSRMLPGKIQVKGGEL